ncbi:MAG: hypothetical protein U0836_16060 [Pirellulales bacterium]
MAQFSLRRKLLLAVVLVAGLAVGFWGSEVFLDRRDQEHFDTAVARARADGSFRNCGEKGEWLTVDATRLTAPTAKAIAICGVGAIGSLGIKGELPEEIRAILGVEWQHAATAGDDPSFTFWRQRP